MKWRDLIRPGKVRGLSTNSISALSMSSLLLTRGNLVERRDVNRQTWNHETTISETENRANVMSTVDMFSPDIAAQYGRKMVEIESRGNGDQMNALERVGRECGLKARALRRIINGETTPTLPVFLRMRAGYLNICTGRSGSSRR